MKTTRLAATTLSALVLLFGAFACSSSTDGGATVSDSEVCSSSETCVCTASCSRSCDGGACRFDCKAGQTCDFSCSGGNCNVTCEGNANCNVTCSGNGCEVAGGTGSVKVTGCTKNCQVVCDPTAASCSSSCTDPTAGCVGG